MSQNREPVMIAAPPLERLSCPHAWFASPARQVVLLEIFGLHESLELIGLLVRPTSNWQSWRLYIVRPSPFAIVPRCADCLLDGFDPATPLASNSLEQAILWLGCKDTERRYTGEVSLSSQYLLNLFHPRDTQARKYWLSGWRFRSSNFASNHSVVLSVCQRAPCYPSTGTA